MGLFDINVAGVPITPVAEIVASRGLPFIFLSGYGPDGRPQAFDDKPLLRKPFSSAELEKLINSVIDGKVER